jgi:hypothetical protein
MMQDRPTFTSPWSVFLVLASTAGSLIFACATPFAAVAAVAVLTLPPRLALVTTMGVWLGNQAVGFLMLGYPLTPSALAWGPILGGAAIVATAVAIQVAGQFERNDVRRWLAVFAAALATQQGLVLVAGLAEGTASLKVVAGISALNAVWAIGLALAFRLLPSRGARAGALLSH